MKTVDITNLGITVSALGFGAMRLPQKNGAIDQAQVNEMVKYAFDNGINYFDTAVVYNDGKSEISLGIALKQISREKFFVADKMPFWGAKSPAHLDQTFEGSLTRLDTDYVDFYLMHSMDRKTFAKAKKLGAIEWAIEKKKQGKIKYLGFSIHDDYDLLLEVLEAYAWDFAQIQYNYLDLDDNPGQKGYDELVSRGIPIIIMEPLKGGILSDIPENLSKPFIDLGGSNVSFAFRWLAEKPGLCTILTGVSNIAQLKENIDIFKDIKPLNAKENAAIAKVEANIKAAQKVNCTGCRYCMPCPIAIEIPELFKAWNTKSMQQSTNWVSGADINKAMAEKCISCGNCTSHCPQKIDIPAKLKLLASEA